MLWEQHHRMLATKLSTDKASFLDGSPIVPDVLWRALAGSKYNSQEKGVILAASDGLWTQDRLREAGYLVNVLCPLCSAEPDSLHHRLWICSAAANARSSLGIDSTVIEATM